MTFTSNTYFSTSPPSQANPAWTDITTYVLLPDAGGSGIQVQRGRADSIGDVNPGTLTLSLDNSGGQFTPGSAADMGLRKGCWVRQTVTFAGTTYNRFTGFVTSQPVGQLAGDSTVQLQATDWLSKLGQSNMLYAAYSMEVLADPQTDSGAATVLGYWALNDAGPSTQGGLGGSATDLSGNAQVLRATAVGDGQGSITYGQEQAPGFDSDTGVAFTPGTGNKSGLVLAGELSQPVGPAFTIEFWAKTTLNGVYGSCFLALADPDSSVFFAVYTNKTGDLAMFTSASSAQSPWLGNTGGHTLGVGPSLCDGTWHHVAILVTNAPDVPGTPGNVYGWVDGVQLNTSPAAMNIPDSLDTLSIGGWTGVTTGYSIPALLNGSVYGVAIMTAGDGNNFASIGTHAQACLGPVPPRTTTATTWDGGQAGFAGENAGDRLVRLARYAGIPSAWTNFPVSGTVGTFTTQTFTTPGLISWNCPAAGVVGGVITAECWGASGGSGGDAAGNSSGAGGAGAAEYSKEVTLAVTAGHAYGGTVGAGGTAGAKANGNGGPGGNSTFSGDSVAVTAHGGGGGHGGSAGAGGSPGTGSTNGTHFNGGAGGPGTRDTFLGHAVGGNGGSSGGIIAAGNTGKNRLTAPKGTPAVSGGGPGGVGGYASAGSRPSTGPGGAPGGSANTINISVAGLAGLGGRVRLSYTPVIPSQQPVSTILCGPQQVLGRLAVDVMREVARTESMPLYVTGGGMVTMQPRNTRCNPVPAFTLQAIDLDAGTTITDDFSYLINEVDISLPAGASVKSLGALGIASQLKYGRYYTTIQAASHSVADAQNLGQWLVYQNSDPGPRWQTMFEAATLVGVAGYGSAFYTAVLSADLSTSFTLASLLPYMPGSAAGSSQLTIEGITEVIDAGLHHFTVSTTPSLTSVFEVRELNTNPKMRANIFGWNKTSSGGGGTFAFSTAQDYVYNFGPGAPTPSWVPSGTGSGLLTPGGTDTFIQANGTADGTNRCPVAGNGLYTVGAWVYSPPGNGNVYIGVTWYDGSGSVISTSDTSFTVPAAAWTYLIAPVTSPSNAGTAIPHVGESGTPAASALLYINDAELVDVTSVTDAGYVWAY